MVKWKWRKKIIAPFLDATASWDKSGLMYVSQFRENLDELAADLSTKTGNWVSSRYVPERRCAELFSPCDRTLAWVTVHGAVCIPYAVHVSLPFLPPTDVQQLIREHLLRPRFGYTPKEDMQIQFHAFA